MLLTISGSARLDSTNSQLLSAITELVPNTEFVRFDIHQLPLFADLPKQTIPDKVVAFRKLVARSKGVIIATPEYAHNLPAALKNALEWLVASGEMVGKPVLPITLTPHSPRGEKCMQSLCWTLAAIDAKIVVQLPLYQPELTYVSDRVLADCPAKEILTEALQLF